MSKKENLSLSRNAGMCFILGQELTVPEQGIGGDWFWNTLGGFFVGDVDVVHRLSAFFLWETGSLYN